MTTYNATESLIVALDMLCCIYISISLPKYFNFILLFPLEWIKVTEVVCTSISDRNDLTTF